jgi:hypothetical protein
MIANAIHTKWKFIVEFEDEETGEIAGTLGEAADRDECEVLVEEEMEYQRVGGTGKPCGTGSLTRHEVRTVFRRRSILPMERLHSLTANAGRCSLAA